MKYNDSDTLHVIERGYNESTRSLNFHSEPIGVDRLQEALDIIGKYNDFDSKIVGEALIGEFGDTCDYVVGRESSVVIYVLPREPYLFWLHQLDILRRQAKIDEVAVTHEGRVRLWWD